MWQTGTRDEQHNIPVVNSTCCALQITNCITLCFRRPSAQREEVQKMTSPRPHLAPLEFLFTQTNSCADMNIVTLRATYMNIFIFRCNLYEHCDFACNRYEHVHLSVQLIWIKPTWVQPIWTFELSVQPIWIKPTWVQPIWTKTVFNCKPRA